MDPSLFGLLGDPRMCLTYIKQESLQWLEVIPRIVEAKENEKQDLTKIVVG